jgi:hypothetical protein
MKVEETIDRLEKLLEILQADKSEKNDEHEDCCDEECKHSVSELNAEVLSSIEECKYYLAEKVNRDFYNEVLHNGNLLFSAYLYTMVALAYNRKETFKRNVDKFKETTKDALLAIEKLGEAKLK